MTKNTGGYQPSIGGIDLNNPPRGGSGAPLYHQSNKSKSNMSSFTSYESDEYIRAEKRILRLKVGKKTHKILLSLVDKISLERKSSIFSSKYKYYIVVELLGSCFFARSSIDKYYVGKNEQLAILRAEKLCKAVKNFSDMPPCRPPKAE